MIFVKPISNQETVKSHVKSILTRCVAIAPCDWVGKHECPGNVPILLEITSHVSGIFDFQLSLSVVMHLSGCGNICNNGGM